MVSETPFVRQGDFWHGRSLCGSCDLSQLLGRLGNDAGDPGREGSFQDLQALESEGFWVPNPPMPPNPRPYKKGLLISHVGELCIISCY